MREAEYMIYDSTVADGSFEMSLKCSELRSLCNSDKITKKSMHAFYMYFILVMYPLKNANHSASVCNANLQSPDHSKHIMIPYFSSVSISTPSGSASP
jgi:hypothetical protein